ncbi:MAG: hypothetical protein ACU833_09400 [Gammaproteobacteria bacterium]
MKNFIINGMILAGLILSVPLKADPVNFFPRGAFARGHGSAGWVDHRQAQQQMRMDLGAHKGLLTRGELNKLGREQNRIDRLEKRFGRDGYLSRIERQILETRLAQAGNRIQRMMRNDRYDKFRNRSADDHYIRRLADHQRRSGFYSGRN